MRPTHLKHLTAALITLVVTVPLTWAAVSTIRVGNPSPVFEELPSDGGVGSVEEPLHFGDIVPFTAMATDVNGDDYYLALCKTDAITPMDGRSPICDDGAWAVSRLTPSGDSVELDYVVQKGAELESEWFAFVCDRVEFGSNCSKASQGELDEMGSPFYVHKQVGVLRYGADCPDVVELDALRQDLEASFEDPISFLSEALSKKEIRDLLDETLAGGPDKKEVNRYLKLVSGQLTSLESIQESVGSVKKVQKDAVADTLLAKRAKFKKMAESNVRFCVTTSTDDSIENVVGKTDKKFEVKNAHKVNKDTLKLDFANNKTRSISMEFLQKKAKPSSLFKNNSSKEEAQYATVEYKNPDDPNRFDTGEPPVGTIADEVFPDPVDIYKTVTLRHESLNIPPAEVGFLEQLLGDAPFPAQPYTPPSYEMSALIDPEVNEVVYHSSDNRRTDIYQYSNSPTSVVQDSIKNYTIFHYGNGTETELYSFDNAVLYINDRGEIEGYYSENIDLSQNEEAAGVSSDLLARASRTLARDFIESINQNGNGNPDFTISVPFVLDREGNAMDTFSYEITGDTFNQLEISFTASEQAYPLVLDPRLSFTAPGASGSVTDKITHSTTNTAFGRGIASGDLNSDGKADLVVGADNLSGGIVYIFYGDGGYSSSESGADDTIASESVSYFGQTLKIGDFDADGDDDLVVIAHRYTSYAGRVYVFLNDGTGIYPDAASADIKITGEASSYFGDSTEIGDLNGDGLDDLAIGAWYYSSNTGKVYVYYGNGDGTLGPSSCTTACAAVSDANVIISDTGALGSNLGSSLAIGDLDNDGFDDLAIGAKRDSSFFGAAYVFYSEATAASAVFQACGTACNIATHRDAFMDHPTSSYFGDSMTIEDFDGDGDDDLAVGAPTYNPGASTTGRVYVFYNGVYPANPTSADVVIQGESGTDYFGSHLISGDINSDGANDLVASAYRYGTEKGRVYGFYNNGGIINGTTCSHASPCIASVADVVITGEEDGDWFGSALSLADFNSDGTLDLGVGGYGASSYGQVYIFYGEGGLESRNVITGVATNEDFSTGMVAGDFDGDGTTDLAVGGYRYSSYRGRVYIFYNDGNYQGTSAGADETITGANSNDYFGNSLAAGDITGNGRTDLVVGAYRSPAGTRQGYVYVYQNDGSYQTSANAADIIISGGATNNDFGTTLVAGDFNADGNTDLAIGAPLYNSSQGRTYVFHSNGDGTLSATSCNILPSCTAANANVTTTGQAITNNFGKSLATGDMNNDGRTDLIVGANTYSTETGRVYILLNDVGGIPTTAATADYIIQGQFTYNDFGVTVGVGDLDNDGTDDLVVGANRYNNTYAGRTYIFYQDTIPFTNSTACTTNCLAANADVAIDGTNWYGLRPPVITDIDGDGDDDLITSNWSTGGYVYVMYNDGSWPATTSAADVFIQQPTDGSSGWGSNVVAGDFNSDGRMDLAIGDTNYSTNTGRLHMLYGDVKRTWDNKYPWRNFNDDTYPSGNRHQIEGWSVEPDYTTGNALFTNSSATVTGSGTSWTDDMIGGQIKNNANGIWYSIVDVASTTSLTISPVYDSTTTSSSPYTIALGEMFGKSFATGDFDSDGDKDIAVGAPGYDSNRGRVYIFFNNNGFTLNASEADVVITGGAVGDEFGYALVSGKVSETVDAIDDLVVGAPGANADWGYAYVFNGRTSWNSSYSAATEYTHRVREDAAGHRCGTALISGLDLSGDAREDFAFSCPGTPGDANGYYFDICTNDGTYPIDSYCDITPSMSGTNKGFSIAAGDVTGDGNVDLIVGDPYLSSGTGAVYVYPGPGLSSLTYTITGTSAGDYFGTSVAVANMDNYPFDNTDDLLVGAPGASSDEGYIYIFWNDSTLLGDIACTAACTAVNADAVVGPFSASTNHGAGSSLAVGDLNRDGKDDIAFGASTFGDDADPNYTNRGAIGTIYGDFNFAINDYAYHDSGTNTYLGGTDLLIDDLDGNGWDDLIAGAPGDNMNRGMVVIYDFNKDSIEGATSSKLGNSVATGDFDGDGDQDLAVGSPGYNSNQGMVNIFFEDASSVTKYSNIYSDADVTITGNTGQRFGFDIAAGDIISGASINPDGIDDLIIGAPTNGVTGAAGVYLYQGRTSWNSSYTYSNAYDDTSWSLVATNECGYQVGIGHVDDEWTSGDDFADPAYTCPGYNSGAGQGLLFYNSRYDGYADNFDKYCYDDLTGTFLGRSFAIGDVDGDGDDDMIGGGPDYNSNQGYVAICYNDSAGPGTYPDIEITGEASSRFGTSVAVGDLDGDGDADIVAGAPEYGSTTGRSYIFYNNSGITAGAAATVADEIITGTTADYFGQAVGIGDMNLDGKKDLVIGSEEHLYTYFNDGDGYYPTSYLSYDLRYYNPSAVNYSTRPQRIFFGDLSRDGKEDLLWGVPGASTGKGYMWYYEIVDIACEPPTIGSVSIIDTSGFTNDATPEIQLDYSYDTGQSESVNVPNRAKFSCDNTNWSAEVAMSVFDSSTVTTSAFNITNGVTGCTTTNEQKTIYVRLANDCGYYPRDFPSDTTYYDTVGPSSGTPSLVVNSVSQITVTAGAPSDPNLSDGNPGSATPYDYQYYDDGCTGAGGDYTTWTTSTHPFTSLPPNTQYSWKSLARDELDNAGSMSVSCSPPKYTLATNPSATVWTQVISPTSMEVDVNPGCSSWECAISIHDNGGSYGSSFGTWYVTTPGTIQNGAYWDTDLGYTAVTGLSPNTQYFANHMNRNGDNVETGWGTQTSAWTLASQPTFSSQTPSTSGILYAWIGGGPSADFDDNSDCSSPLAIPTFNIYNNLASPNTLVGSRYVCANNSDGVTNTTAPLSFPAMYTAANTPVTGTHSAQGTDAITWGWSSGGAQANYIFGDNSQCTDLQWSAQTSGLSVQFNDVYFADANNGWLVGEGGAIRRTTNGGTNWNTSTSNTSNDLYGVHFESSTLGWAVGAGGTIRKTTDGGATGWSTSTSSTTNTIYDIDVRGTTGMAVGVGLGTGVTATSNVRYTTNGGTSWAGIPTSTSETFRSISSYDASNAWLVGTNGTIYYWDGGAWTIQTSFTSNTLYDVDFSNSSSIGWAVGANGTILKTTNGGTNWGSQTSGTTEDLTDIYCLDTSTCYVVGGNGTMLRTISGGTNWRTARSGTDSNLWGVHAFDSATVWSSGAGGTILKAAESTTNTSFADPGLSANTSYTRYVCARNGDEVLTSELTIGPFYTSANTPITPGQSNKTDTSMRWTWASGGAQTDYVWGDTSSCNDLFWTNQTSGTSNALNDVDVLSGGLTGWIVGDGGTILKTTTGTSWSAQASGTTTNLNDVYAYSAGWAWVVGDSGEIHQTINGVNWSSVSSGTGSNLHDIEFMNIGTEVFAVGDSGTILYSTDGSVFAPQTSCTGSHLYGVGAYSGSYGIAVGASGAVCYTVNDGATWNTGASGSSETLYDVRMTSSISGLAVGSNGTILTTSNGGSTWSSQTSGTTEDLYKIHWWNGIAGYWASGANGTLLYSSNSVNWTVKNSGDSVDLYSVDFIDSSLGWSVGPSGLIKVGDLYSTNTYADETGLTPNTSYTRYACARNGNSDKTGALTIGPYHTLATAPSSPTLSNRQITSLDVNVNVNGNPASTEFAIYVADSAPNCDGSSGYGYVQWNVSGSGGLSGSATWDTDTDWTEDFTVTGLSPATTYYFCVKAKNADSIETSFSTTSNEATLGPPTFDTMVISDTGGFTKVSTPTINITKSGSVPTDVYWNCDNSTWTQSVAYSSDVITNVNIASGVGGCSESDGSRTVYMRLWNAVGFSGTLNDSTYYDNTGPTVSIASAVNDSPTQITVTATTPDDGTGSGAPYEYYFPGYDGAGCSSVFNMPNYTTNNYYANPGLSANTLYSFEVDAKDELGNLGSTSACVPAYTSANTPITPGSTNVTDTEIRWTWASGGAQTDYQINNLASAGWFAQSSSASSAVYVDFLDNQVGYLVSGTLTRKTTNGGDTWVAQTTASNSQLSIDCYDTNTCWSGGIQGDVFGTTNGSTWSLLDTTGTGNIFDIEFASATVGYFVDFNGEIFKTTDGGDTFSSTYDHTGPLNGIAVVDTSTVYAVGDNGAIFKTINGGTGWTDQSISTIDDFQDIDCADSTHCFIVDNGTTNYVRKTVNGSDWTIVNTGISQSLLAIDCIDQNICAVVGGDVYVTVDAGLDWGSQGDPTDTDWARDVVMTDVDHGWVGADNGVIMVGSSGIETTTNTYYDETGLTPGTTYSNRNAYARNEDDDLTVALPLSSVTTLPSVSSITISDTGGFTNDTTPEITIAYEGGTPPTHVAFSCNGGTDWSADIAYPGDDTVNDSGSDFNMTVNLASGGSDNCTTTNENKTITARVKNASGYSANTAQDITYYDTTAPTVNGSGSQPYETQLYFGASAIDDGSGSADPYDAYLELYGDGVTDDPDCEGATGETVSGTNSGWVIDDLFYLFTGLNPNTQYSFRAKVRDELDNEGGFGPCSARYTLASTPLAPTLSAVSGTSISINPNSGGAEKEIAIYIEAGATCDGIGGYYLDASGGNNGATELWQTEVAWSAVIATGLSQHTQYSACSKARNEADNETSFGASTSDYTSNSYPQFTVTPSDSGSDSTTPTNVGSNVTFTATALDIDSDDYYLIACSTGNPVPGNDTAPTCSSGTTWAVGGINETSISYTALAGDAESEDWGIGVCDKLPTAAGPDCWGLWGSPSLNYGQAMGTITFTGLPADEDYVTLGGKIWRFDTGGNGCVGLADGGCLDISSAVTAEDVADVWGITGGSNFTIGNSGAVVYMYADNEGVGGNSIGFIESLDTNTVMTFDPVGGTLTGGSDSNASPFKVNHAPEVVSVAIGDTTGGTGTIEPGDTVHFDIDIADSDTDGTQDLVNLYVCSTDSFTPGVGCGGTEICGVSNINPSINAGCDDGGSLVPIPTAAEDQTVYIFIEDTHDLQGTYLSGTQARIFSVGNAAPTLVSYAISDGPAPAAAGSDTVIFTALIQDENGEDDVSVAEGFFFDATAVTPSSGVCTEHDNNCYKDATCTLDTAAGTSSQVEVECTLDVWFNANNSANWEVRVNPTDTGGKDLTLANSNININNPLLSGISVPEAGINYGASLALGATSLEKTATIQNVGNYIIDAAISGTNMTYSTYSIPRANQEWSSSTFTYGAGNDLVPTATSVNEASGCFDASLPVRTVYSSGQGSDDTLYWQLQIPSTGLGAGTYSGTNTVQIITCQ